MAAIAGKAKGGPIFSEEELDDGGKSEGFMFGEEEVEEGRDSGSESADDSGAGEVMEFSEEEIPPPDLAPKVPPTGSWVFTYSEVVMYCDGQEVSSEVSPQPDQ